MANVAKAVEALLEANKNSILSNHEKPAYPTNGRMHSDMTGLTKREAFAMAAMQGMCHSYFVPSLSKQSEAIGANIDIAIATAAVSLADELLKQLES